MTKTDGALVLAFALAVATPAPAAEHVPAEAAIAAAHPAATAAGRVILDRGGNAFDAAVAVAAALAVAEPYSSGLGGGGFLLLHRARDGKDVVIDAREKAPQAASRDMYLDAKGEFVATRSLNGALAAAIPGLPAGLVLLSRHYGRLPLADSLAPAIELAEQGFAVTKHYQMMAGFRAGVLKADAEAGRLFLHEGAAPEAGTTIVQRDLGATLRKLAASGQAGFYAGPVAKKLVDGVRAAGGIWTLEDLQAYRAVERVPLAGTYHGIRIVSAPPPSSGGVVLLEALNILEPYAVEHLDAAGRRHVVIEAMRRAYRDRAAYLGDPDFVEVPVGKLTAKPYAAELAKSIDEEHATPSSALPAVGAASPQGPHTTHFSVLDTEGNRVAATLSINYPFGAAVVPPGTGVLLNDEMDDFSARPATPNGYGLVGDEANAIAPGKRPLSSMTPTFLEAPDRIGVLGTPGGSRIVSMVLLGALEFAAGKPPADWVGAPRYHHQYLPDEVQFEQGGLDEAAQADLKRRGHALKPVDRRYGNMQAILWSLTNGEVSAASDPRGEGESVVWKPHLASKRLKRAAP
ncbi:MAG: gamma-glutamyltransferase [Gammaproteobacteria bacterium]|nr:gamma-glutamyltransferase [Gammaproteobacteria bacterium]